MVRFAPATVKLLALVLAAGSIGVRAPSRTSVTVEAREPGQSEMTDWAVGRFAEAGLDLPSVVIRFHGSDLSMCGGAPARAYAARDPAEIAMCWDDRWLLLHELGHIWEATTVSTGVRNQFMHLRDGVESWANREDDWPERGEEHAANVIAWGLLEDPRIVSKTYPNDPQSMLEAFVLLTGVEPLHDGGPGVQMPDRSLFAGRTNLPLESGR